MKLQFDAELEYQKKAVSSVVDLFEGQMPVQSKFTIVSAGQEDLRNKGTGNRLELDYEEILENLRQVQLRNGLSQSRMLKELDFDIEMETGTGKTYVYLRTILELNKKYGFSKFIIVVPGIAIKEGVYKTLEITREHFAQLYDRTPYNYFVYDSSKLEQIRNFATDSSISIMIINIDAFRKSFQDPEKENKANIIHRTSDKISGLRPIELLAQTNPAVIIDEPQSVDTTPRSREAVESLNPLFILRYSATHRVRHHLIYRLDAVDSFEMGLVKQIEVAGIFSQDYHNQAYVKLLSVNNKRAVITAGIEMDVREKGSIRRKKVTVKKGDDLYEKSGGRDVYDGYIVEEIYCQKGSEYISFLNRKDAVFLNQYIGDIDEDEIKEQQIRRTIEMHLDKQMALKPLGIKVLSLFFIDRVTNYRAQDERGVSCKGKYARMFEKNFTDLIQKPRYKELLEGREPGELAKKVHNGYFSCDRKGILKDTSGTTLADDSAYELIMKDKERLLSFDTELCFIFSHSALREGWDNPNVFQICTLNETNSEIKKRQEIGRGLRLCVNQEGIRQYEADLNILTVMANESYESFAQKLQTEYEEEEGIRFGVLERHSFASVVMRTEMGSGEYLGQKNSEMLYEFFQKKGYIDYTGKVLNSLKIALKYDLLEIPAELERARAGILDLCRKICGRLQIKNADEKRETGINQEILDSWYFQSFWEKIKEKGIYKVQFSTEALVENCCKELKERLVVSSSKLVSVKAGLKVDQSGVETRETERRALALSRNREMLPDVITYLQSRTSLTRRTIVEILVKSETLHLFKKNPQRYQEEAAKIILTELRLLLTSNIQYEKAGKNACYSKWLLKQKRPVGYLKENMMESRKSIYTHIIYDSAMEQAFAEKLENNEDVKIYFKFPGWYKIPTPFGNYTPDWGIITEKEGKIQAWVLETKGNIEKGSLRVTEEAKIHCGKRFFALAGEAVKFEPVDSFEKWMEET